MQPLTATAAKPPDDIDAVLGRFQAWSASRKTTGKTLQKAAPKKSDVLPDGVRELSHEEALESSRSRWQARTKPSVICDSTGETPTSADGNQFRQSPRASPNRRRSPRRRLTPKPFSPTNSASPAPDRQFTQRLPRRNPSHQHLAPCSPKPSPPNPTPTRILARWPSSGRPHRKTSARYRCLCELPPLSRLSSRPAPPKPVSPSQPICASAPWK
jgi:hypothetical protein